MDFKIWMGGCGLDIFGWEGVDWIYLDGRVWTGYIWMGGCGMDIFGSG
jgi:hypothetical protein